MLAQDIIPTTTDTRIKDRVAFQDECERGHSITWLWASHQQSKQTQM